MPQNTRVHVESFTINPKCVSLGELYGQVDPSTMEWSDGLVASAVRAYAKELFQQESRTSINSCFSSVRQDDVIYRTCCLLMYEHELMYVL